MEQEVIDKIKILRKASWISIIVNLLLSLLKIIIGFFSGSLAVLSDGIDSVSDVFTSTIILLTSFFAYSSPSKKYAYGKEKAENMATTILSFVIFFVGVQMIITAFKRILSFETAEMPSPVSIIAVLVSIFGKFALAINQFHQGKKINSAMLMANAINIRNDVIMSITVLAGLICTFWLKIPVMDPILAIIVSLFIIYSAIKIFKEANVILLDGIDDTSIYKKIISAVEKVPAANNPHRIRVGRVGNLYNIVLDIEADGNLTLVQAHNIADTVEENIRNEVSNVYDIIIHVEPKGNVSTQEKFGINKMHI